MRYIFEPKGDATVMHIELFNALGESSWRPICAAELTNPRTINIRLGCSVCPECLRMAKYAALDDGRKNRG